MTVNLCAPCPFCLSQNVEPRKRRAPKQVICRSCGAKGPVATDDDGARRLWNAYLEGART